MRRKVFYVGFIEGFEFEALCMLRRAGQNRVYAMCMWFWFMSGKDLPQSPMPRTKGGPEPWVCGVHVVLLI